MSWWKPSRAGAKRQRHTGFIGTLTQARNAKYAERIRAQQELREIVAVAEPQPASIPTLYAFTKDRLTDTLARRQITTDGYERSYRSRIHEALGAYRLDEFTPAMLRTWCDDLVRREGDRISAQKAAKVVTWLFNEAIAEGHITTNPAAGMKFERRAKAAVSKGAPSRTDFATKKPALNRPQYEQLKSYAASVGSLEHVIIRLIVEGALRRSEVLGLQWRDYDRDARTFAVTGAVTYAPTSGTTIDDTKTVKSDRLVVLSRDLCDAIDLFRATRTHTPLATSTTSFPAASATPLASTPPNRSTRTGPAS